MEYYRICKILSLYHTFTLVIIVTLDGDQQSQKKVNHLNWV